MSLRYSEKEEFLDRVYRKGNSPQSKKSAQQALDRFTKFCLDKFQRSDDSIINDIKSNKLDVYKVLDSFVAHLQKDGIASTVIHVWMSWLKGYLGYCDIEIADNIFRSKVSMPKIHKRKDGAMDREQAARILQSLPMKLRLICMLEATTIRRPHEIIRWRVRDFDFESKPTTISIPANIAKNDYETETFTTNEVTSLLKDYISKNRLKPDDLIFQHITENSATGAFRRFMKQLPELNSRIEGTRRFNLHLYSYKKFGWTRASRKHGDSYADGLKGDKNAHEYHRSPLEEKRQLYLQLEPQLTFFNADLINKELESQHENQSRKIEQLQRELKQEKISREELTNKVALEVIDLFRDPKKLAQIELEEQLTKPKEHQNPLRIKELQDRIGGKRKIVEITKGCFDEIDAETGKVIRAHYEED